MPTKIKIYTVLAPFAHAKQEHKVGDEFALPAGWTREEESPEGRAAFLEPYTQTYYENGEKKTDTFYRRVLLPVEEKA